MTPATTTQNGRFVKGAWIPDIPEPSSHDAATIPNVPGTIDESTAVEIVCTLKQQCEQIEILSDAFSAQMHLNEAICMMSEVIEDELVSIRNQMLTKDVAAALLIAIGLTLVTVALVIAFA